MKKLAVFYNENQSVPAHIQLTSPSPGKPRLVVEGWVKENRAIDIHSDFSPVTREDLKLAHFPLFVDGILDCWESNGFGTKHPEVAAALPWTTGSFYAAAKYAYLNRTITCSPTSGFHHAEYANAQGFCTFNGLIVSAMKLKQEFPEIRIGIVDCDHHYGNGTDNLIVEKKIDYITHYTFGGEESNHYNWGGGSEAADWTSRLPSILERFQNCDLIFYQAGADPHASDPFGGALSDEQLAKRDQIVLGFFAQKKIPLSWNFAGGYQSPISKVLSIHNATLDAALQVIDQY